VLAEAILKLQVVEEPYEMAARLPASTMEPFHTSEPLYAAKKTVFENLPYSRQSDYERQFMRYLDEQEEVQAYTKVLSRMPLRIPYHDPEGYLRHYRPDFVVKTKRGYCLIETKGKGWDNQVEVKAKTEAARAWCAKVSEITGGQWAFVKVLQSDFERFQPLPFADLVKASNSEEGAWRRSSEIIPGPDLLGSAAPQDGRTVGRDG